MSHLTFDELLKYAKRTIRYMHDENGNIKKEYTELMNKINNYIGSCPECYKMLIMLQNTNSVEEIEKLREEYNRSHSLIIDNVQNKNEFENNLREIDGILIDEEKVKIYYEYPEILNGGMIVNQQEKQAYIKAVQEYSVLQEQKQSGSQMDKPKVLVKKDKNSIAIEEDIRQAGFINILLLSLATGFAGGVITTIMYMFIK